MDDRFKFRFWDSFNECMTTDDLIGTVNCLSMYMSSLSGKNNPVLMQSTGLRDKNVNLIFEGDGLFWDGSYIGYVYHSGRELLVGFGNENHDRALCAMPNGEVEIIGNVHEHPHLLNDSQDEVEV